MCVAQPQHPETQQTPTTTTRWPSVAKNNQPNSNVLGAANGRVIKMSAPKLRVCPPTIICFSTKERMLFKDSLYEYFQRNAWCYPSSLKLVSEVSHCWLTKRTSAFQPSLRNPNVHMWLQITERTQNGRLILLSFKKPFLSSSLSPRPPLPSMELEQWLSS